MKKIMIWIWILLVFLVAILLFVVLKSHEQFTSAVIGGLIAGGFSLIAIKVSHSNDLELQRRQEEKDVLNFLNALHVEITTLWRRYRKRIGKRLDELKPGELFNMNVSMTQDYFSVYNTNASLVGKIENNNLRNLIVEVNIEEKGLIDNFLIHNNALDEFRKWVVICNDNPNKTNIRMRDEYRSSLVKFAASLKEEHTRINRLIDELDRMLSSYLSPKSTGSLLD